MSLLNHDLNVFYFGGSGGFYFLHYVMLWGQHWCYFPGNKDFSQVFQRQWAVSDINQWKRTEHWPDNAQTLAQTAPLPYKIYLTCNSISQWLSLPGQRVLLYTDIQSQIRLSRAKKTQFASVKGRRLLTDSVIYQQRPVLGDIQQVVPHVDHSVYLQDLILDPEHTLGLEPTPSHDQFTQHWLSLHPKQLLKKINL